MVLGPARGRRAQPSPSPLPAGDRAKTEYVGPRNLQTKRLGQAAAPVEAASATSVQVVARRAAGAEIVRTGVVVTPRGTVGARGDLIADRAGAAASRVVNARVCRASGHGGKVVGGGGGERGGESNAHIGCTSSRTRRRPRQPPQQREGERGTAACRRAPISAAGPQGVNERPPWSP